LNATNDRPVRLAHRNASLLLMMDTAFLLGYKTMAVALT
jgi:hypothetical protein